PSPTTVATISFWRAKSGLTPARFFFDGRAHLCQDIPTRQSWMTTAGCTRSPGGNRVMGRHVVIARDAGAEPPVSILGFSVRSRQMQNETPGGNNSPAVGLFQKAHGKMVMLQ